MTITAGGNNLGFGDIVTTCGSAMADPDRASACDEASADADGPDRQRRNWPADVAAMIQSVQAAAPNAKIVVTGYPYLYDPIPLDPADPMSAVHLPGDTAWLTA